MQALPVTLIVPPGATLRGLTPKRERSTVILTEPSPRPLQPAFIRYWPGSTEAGISTSSLKAPARSARSSSISMPLR